MSERDGYEHGVPCWVDNWQDDPDPAATFYAGVFGWDVEKSIPPGADTRYYMCRLGGSQVAAIGSPRQAAMPPAWTTYRSLEPMPQRFEDHGCRLLVLGRLVGASRLGEGDLDVGVSLGLDRPRRPRRRDAGLSRRTGGASSNRVRGGAAGVDAAQALGWARARGCPPPTRRPRTCRPRPRLLPDYRGDRRADDLRAWASSPRGGAGGREVRRRAAPG